MHKETISSEGLDLLENMLKIDFYQRFNAENILEHTFLNKFREKSSETKYEKKNDLNFEIEV